MRRTPKLLIVLALMLTALIAATAGGQTPAPTEAFLSPTGDDTADCTSAAPCKTFTRAAIILPAGGDIRLAPGKYGWQSNYQARPTGLLTVHASGATVNGLTCKGCRNLNVLGGRWTGSIVIDSQSGTTNPASNVTLTGLDMAVTSGGASVRIINAARDINVLDSHIVGGAQGVEGAGRPSPDLVSSGITIAGNDIERQTTDGIAFGHWDDVTIDHNVIHDIKDPCPTGTNCIHNDGVQLYGTSQHVRITHNTIIRPRSQGIFVQAQSGPIDDVTAAWNEIRDMFSVPVVFEHVTHGKVLDNLICGGPESDGGLWLRYSGTDYVAKGNLVGSSGQPQDSLKVFDGAAAVVDHENDVVPC